MKKNLLIPDEFNRVPLLNHSSNYINASFINVSYYIFKSPNLQINKNSNHIITIARD